MMVVGEKRKDRFSVIIAVYSNLNHHLNLCSSNDSTGDTSTSISCGLAQLMATQAQIIGIRMDDQSASHNVIRSSQGDVGVTDVHLELNHKNH